MRKLLIILSAFVCLTALRQHQAPNYQHQTAHYLVKNVNNAVYKPKINDLLPGDTIFLQGYYQLIFLDSIYGTPEKPIFIAPLDSVWIGGYRAYCFQIKGHDFKILGDYKTKYGITINGALCTEGYGSAAVGLNDSYNCEISGVQITMCGVGFLENPISDHDLPNIYIHNNRVWNFNDPNSTTGGRAEGVYFGNTGQTSPGKFINCRIENNVFEDLSGDGIQVCQGEFSIKGNTVRLWGKAKLQWQNNGIQVGNDSKATIENNQLLDGEGIALTEFGTGSQTFKNNIISGVDNSTLSGCDIVYMAGRGANYSIDFSGNQFINCKPNRRFITNATPDSLTNGSPFNCNAGVLKSQTLLNSKDVWYDCSILPIDTTSKPKPHPKPKHRYDVKVFDFMGNHLSEFDRNNVEAEQFKAMLPKRKYFILQYRNDKEFLTEKVFKQ